ncbi:MAG: recombination protein RecR [Oscillospiraceae bacterium]|nr:recombination protein RecR [Oscillospiraceae bacterium]
MAYQVASLAKLVEQFARIPGIGRKSAQRYAYYVLSQPRQYAEEFADALIQASKSIKRCKVCQNLCGDEVCPVCANQTRDRSVICVVADPRDVVAFERMREYSGLYHVLHGLISPTDGVGPEQLTVKELLARLNDEVKEVVMATNPTIEGEATAMYISRLIKPMGIKVSRLAYGIPVGGNLEFADDVTLCRALEGRNEM